MSRIGRKPLEIPKGVTVVDHQGRRRGQGPQGHAQASKRHTRRRGQAGQGRGQGRRSCSSARATRPRARRARPDARARRQHGQGRDRRASTRKLEINGVGYKAEIKGQKHHAVARVLAPDRVRAARRASRRRSTRTSLILSGIDRQALGDAAAKIRSFRPPEPYKGKGIKYVEETIMRKAGKTGAA